ncbi:hypothetical protein KAH94_02205 [bacterium]|nr:hypothetical protein [bacterium]
MPPQMSSTFANSHMPSPKPKIAKELAIPTLEEETTKRQHLSIVFGLSRICAFC